MITAGIGVLLLRNWARIMWLGLMPALVLVHGGIIVFNEAFRYGATRYYWFWTGTVVFVSAASWRYFTQNKIRALFSKQNEQNES